MNYKVVTSISDLGEFLPKLQSASEVYLDVETDGLDTLTCNLRTVQILVGDLVFVFDCKYFKNITYIVQLIENKIVVGHNLKFDVSVLYNKTGVLLKNLFDTMLAEIMIHNGIGSKYVALGYLTEKYCGKKLDKDVRESFYKEDSSKDLTQEQVVYSVLDVLYLPAIMENQAKALSDSKQDFAFHSIEMKVLPVIIAMESEGIILDTEHWKRLMDEATQKSNELMKELIDMIVEKLKTVDVPNLLELCRMVNIPVKTKRDTTLLESITDVNYYDRYLRDNLNVASPTQMLAILNIFGVKVESTGEKTLRDLNSKEPIINKLLEFREYAKKGSSFGESFLDKVHPVTGKIHTTLNQLGAETGRFSSEKPNMQQIVHDSEYRDCFVVEPGYKLITVDFSQQELRLTGAMTGEPMFIKAYKEGVDMHTLTASLLFNKKLEEVTKDERRIAKGFNFAVVYGSTANGLAYNFNIPKAEAQKLLDNFYNGYPILAQFKTKFENLCLKYKYTRTASGRRRYFDIREFYENSTDYAKEINSFRRQSFNTLIQGTGADVTKLSLIGIFYNNPYGDKLKPVLTIHDEIVTKVKEDIAEEALEFIKDQMLKAEATYLGEIPPAVDGKISDHWEH